MYKPITDETISNILSKVDIVDVIGEYVHLKKSGRNYLGLCPFHAEKTPSFSVSSEKQFYHCFGCGAGGNIFSFLMEIEGVTFPQSVQMVAEKVGVQLQIDSGSNAYQQQKNETKEWMYKGHQLAAQLFHHMLMERKEGERAREYLKSRGFLPETLVQFQIGYAPDSWNFLTQFLEKRDFPLEIMEKGGLVAKKDDNRYFDRFRDRIIFPIWDVQGKVVGFGGRLLEEGHPKYLNSPESDIFLKRKQLFNFHQARQQIRKEKTIILYEGYVDVISSWQAGVRNATATLGTSLSEEQARMIRRNSENVILCYDGDQAGVEAITKANQLLEKQGCMVKVAKLPDGQDPDEYIQKKGAESFTKNIIRGAKSFVAYRLDALRVGRNLQDDGDRLRYVNEALVEISRLTRAVERDHYLRQLADEFQLSLDALKQEQYKIYRSEKNKQNRDKGIEKWNNNINTSKHLVGKQMFPSYYNAERNLLGHMLKSFEVTEMVKEQVGGQFNIDEHSAMATYLYAYYAEGHPSDVQLFMSKLKDQEMIQLATQLSIISLESNPSDRVLQDYINEILHYPLQLEIEKKEQLQVQLERQGEHIEAAHIAKEIQRIKQQIKDIKAKNYSANNID